MRKWYLSLARHGLYLLDAMHLATVEMLGEPPALVTVLTRDGRVRENAIALGYAVE